MILEALVTSRNDDGTINLAPMGPCCEGPDLEQFELRPFQSSATFRNLATRREGILHVTDDALILVQAAINRVPADLEMRAGEVVDCDFLADCCRYHEFTVTHLDASQARSSMQCRTRRMGHIRDFFGFNRARHQLIEATILVTRMDFVPLDSIRASLMECAKLVEKTGGDREREALRLLERHVQESARSDSAATGVTM